MNLLHDQSFIHNPNTDTAHKVLAEVEGLTKSDCNDWAGPRQRAELLLDKLQWEADLTYKQISESEDNGWQDRANCLKSSAKELDKHIKMVCSVIDQLD